MSVSPITAALPKYWKSYTADTSLDIPSDNQLQGIMVQLVDLSEVCGIKYPNGSDPAINANQVALRLKNGQFVSILCDINTLINDLSSHKSSWLDWMNAPIGK